MKMKLNLLLSVLAIFAGTLDSFAGTQNFMFQNPVPAQALSTKERDEILSKEAMPMVEEIFERNGVTVKCLSIKKIREIGDLTFSGKAYIRDEDDDLWLVDIRIELIDEIINVRVEFETLGPISKD